MTFDPAFTKSKSNWDTLYNPTATSALPVPALPVPVLPVPDLNVPNGLGYPVGPPLYSQNNALCGIWTEEDDRTLLALRAMGKNWNQIQREAFPSKTGNACRKRHERLMERRGASDMDNRKLERLSYEYMRMRKEIWQTLAQRCGEKWNVVEAQCMSMGLKNIHSHYRAYSGRAHLESGQHISAYNAYDDDSGISGLGLTPIYDVVEHDYSSDFSTCSNHDADDTRGGSPACKIPQPHSRDNSPHIGHDGQLPSFSTVIDPSFILIDGGSVIDSTEADMKVDSAIEPTNPCRLPAQSHSNNGSTSHGAMGANTPRKESQPAYTVTVGENPTTLDETSQHFRTQSALQQTTKIKSLERAGSLDSGEASDDSEASSAYQEKIKSPSFLGDSVSEASTGISYSFIRPSANRHGLLGCVVQWLEQWIDQQFRESVSGYCSKETTHGSTGSNPSETIGSQAEKTQIKKGKRPAQDDPPDDDSEDESRKDPKRPKPGGPGISGQRRFACPFFKRNPTRYQEVRSCPGPGYKSIHRLKEHLYRRHLLPKYKCPRCCTPFQNEDELHAHHRSEISCPLHNEEPAEGITGGQATQLRKRFNSSKDEHQRWIDVYRIMFPDDDPSTIPSPYYETTLVQPWKPEEQCSHQEAFSGLKTFLRRQASQRLQEAFEGFEPELRTMLNEKLKQKLTEVLPQVQLDLIDDFRQLDSTPQRSTAENATNSIVNEQPAFPLHTEEFDITDHLAFLENMDWVALGDPNFDIIITPPQVEGISEGSSATHDPEFMEGFLGILPGKEKDSGYGSFNGMDGPGEL